MRTGEEVKWDFGLAVTGDRRGQIFDMDNEGGYGFTAGSFAEFYESWTLPGNASLPTSRRKSGRC